MLLLFAVCLFLTSKASVINYDDLVADIEYTLDECFTIVQHIGDYLQAVHPLDDVRRLAQEDNRNRSEDEEDGYLDVKLGACASIVETVDTYRVNQKRHMRMENVIGAGYYKLNELLGSVSKRMGEILYISSMDGDKFGDGASGFHSACDGKGPTVVVVQSTNGAVFGGYTDVNWTTTTGYMTSSVSFLFRLRPSFKKYVLKSGKESQAVYHNVNYGPTFGSGHDLYVDARYNVGSYTNGGHGYNFPTYPSYELTDGEKYFKVSDFFVVKAIAL